MNRSFYFMALMLAFALILVAMLMYQFTHNWFARNKNR
jgi:hypothetical protein